MVESTPFLIDYEKYGYELNISEHENFNKIYR